MAPSVRNLDRALKHYWQLRHAYCISEFGKRRAHQARQSIVWVTRPVINPHEIVFTRERELRVTGVITIYFLSKSKVHTWLWLLQSLGNAYSLKTFPHEIGNLDRLVPARRVDEDVSVTPDADRVGAELLQRVSDVFFEVSAMKVESRVLLRPGLEFENSCL